MLTQILYALLFGALVDLKPDINPSKNFREVILFACTKDDLLLIKQLKVLKKDKEGLAERAIKISIKVWAKNSSFKKFKIAEKQFAFVLIGKDGVEKFRSTSIVSLEKLYSIIDVMPMWKYEMWKQ